MKSLAPNALSQPARAAVLRSVVIRSKSYDRRRDLPQLVGLDPAETDDGSALVAARLLRRIGRALRRERWRGRAGAPGYDPARHLALLQAYHAERKRLSPRCPAQR